jgi:hypothetical protein
VIDDDRTTIVLPSLLLGRTGHPRAPRQRARVALLGPVGRIVRFAVFRDDHFREPFSICSLASSSSAVIEASMCQPSDMYYYRLIVRVGAFAFVQSLRFAQPEARKDFNLVVFFQTLGA